MTLVTYGLILASENALTLSIRSKNSPQQCATLFYSHSPTHPPSYSDPPVETKKKIPTALSKIRIPPGSSPAPNSLP